MVYSLHPTVKHCHASGAVLCVSVLLVAALAGCFSPDPRSVEGALARALEAATAGDARQLYKVIDERSRHAMISIVADRRLAAEVIGRSYPDEARAPALAALGDAARAEDAAGLFALRCGAECLADFASKLGAPRERHTAGEDVRVLTTRGAELTLHLGSDTWYGIVWHTGELSRERDRAAAEREQVQRNAALYEQRSALQ